MYLPHNPFTLVPSVVLGSRFWRLDRTPVPPGREVGRLFTNKEKKKLYLRARHRVRPQSLPDVNSPGTPYVSTLSSCVPVTPRSSTTLPRDDPVTVSRVPSGRVSRLRVLLLPDPPPPPPPSPSSTVRFTRTGTCFDSKWVPVAFDPLGCLGEEEEEGQVSEASLGVEDPVLPYVDGTRDGL